MGSIGVGGMVKKVIKFIKNLWGFLGELAKEGGDTDSVNDKSSLENIDRITEIFSNFKEEVHQRSIEVEKSISEEVEFYIEEIKQLLMDNEKTIVKYGMRMERIERKINRILPRLEGVIDHEVSKKVSLDNNECKNIMKMIPGEKKEKALQEFLDSAISSALNVCCMNIKENLHEIFEEVNDEILGAVDSLQISSEEQLKQLEEIDADNYIESTTKVMREAYFLIDTCTIVHDIL